jgi:hypothetical protein
MKQWMIVIAAAVAMFGIFGCAGSSNTETSVSESVKAPSDTSTEPGQTPAKPVSTAENATTPAPASAEKCECESGTAGKTAEGECNCDTKAAGKSAEGECECDSKPADSAKKSDAATAEQNSAAGKTPQTESSNKGTR